MTVEIPVKIWRFVTTLTALWMSTIALYLPWENSSDSSTTNDWMWNRPSGAHLDLFCLIIEIGVALSTCFTLLLTLMALRKVWRWATAPLGRQS